MKRPVAIVCKKDNGRKQIYLTGSKMPEVGTKLYLKAELPMLSDEVIAELWHKSGGHLYKFAKILRDWLEEHAS